MASLTRQVVCNYASALRRGFRLGNLTVSGVSRKFGGLIAQTDASCGGPSVRAFGRILRDHKNNALCRKSVWVINVSESSSLELSGMKHLLYYFAGSGVELELINDYKAAIGEINREKDLFDEGYSLSSIITDAMDKDKKKQNRLN